MMYFYWVVAADARGVLRDRYIPPVEVFVAVEMVWYLQLGRVSPTMVIPSQPKMKTGSWW